MEVTLCKCVLMVNDIPRNLNVKKSVGPDGIDPKVLKELSNELCRRLTILFNSLYFRTDHGCSLARVAL